ncbi:MAG TPA: hypothetical protein VGF64_11965 [Acidimicrobiales bacterium]
MIITSVVLLAAAFGLLIFGAAQGNPTLLEVSLGAAAAGALALFAGNASARRIAVARGIPVESVLASRVRRSPAAPAEPTPPAEAAPRPPIDGYDEMPGREVARLVASGALPDAVLSEMLLYEASHKRRRVVLTTLIDVVGPGQAPAASRAGPRRAEEPAEPG